MAGHRAKPRHEPGPEQQRLVIAAPQAARNDLLKQKAKELKARFDAAHADGMAALKKGDTAAFGDAIDREIAITEEQSELIEAARPQPTPFKD